MIADVGTKIGDFTIKGIAIDAEKIITFNSNGEIINVIDRCGY